MDEQDGVRSTCTATFLCPPRLDDVPPCQKETTRRVLPVRCTWTVFSQNEVNMGSHDFASLLGRVLLQLVRIGVHELSVCGLRAF